MRIWWIYLDMTACLFTAGLPLTQIAGNHLSPTSIKVFLVGWARLKVIKDRLRWCQSFIMNRYDYKDTQEAKEKLKAGEVLGLPTETVYGLAADIARRCIKENL